MAHGNIETFTDNVPAPKADEAGSAAYEQLGRHVEASFSQAGSALRGATGEIGQVVEQHEEASDAADVANGFAALDAKTAIDANASRSTMDPHDPNTVQDFMSAHQEALDQIGAKLRTDKGRALYVQLAAKYRYENTNKMVGITAQAAVDDTTAKVSAASKQFANTALSDPTTAVGSAATVDAMASLLPVEVRGKVASEMKQEIFDSAGEGIVGKATGPNATPDDIATAKKLLNDPGSDYVKNMSPSQFASVNARLDKAGESLGATAGVIAAQTLGNGYQQMAGNGGLDPNNQWQGIIDHYKGATTQATAEWKADQQRKYDAAKSYGVATAGVADMSSDDIASKIGELQTKADGAGPNDLPNIQAQLQAVTTATQARDKAFAADPAGYVVGSSEVVGRRYTQFAQNQTPANFQAYAAASIAEQQRLYPHETPNVVSSEMEDTISKTIQSGLASKEGPGAVASALASYANLAGSYWPQMATRLRQDKVIPAGAGVAAELYGDPKTSALAETVIQATMLPAKDLQEKFGITSDKAIALANEQLKPIITTMGNIPNSDLVISDYRSALAATIQFTGAMGTNRFTGAMDVTAVAALANKMIVGRFDIQDNTLRVPKAPGLDASRIGDGAVAVRAGIADHQLVPPPHFAEMGVSPSEYARQIKNTGRWYANENGTGAILYDEDMHTVKEIINGKPRDVELSWDALGQVADKQPMRAVVKAAAGALDKVTGGP